MRADFCLIALAVFAAASPAAADKVLMKNGKVYEGKIMGETDDSVLFSSPPSDPTPRFLYSRDILTIVRQSRPPEPAPDRTYFPTLELLVGGHLFNSNTFSFGAAPGFEAGAGFRLCPAFELDANLSHWPTLSSDLTITDGKSARDYHSFYSYGGGFSAKVLPFFKRTRWRAEPYLLGGFEWTRLIPKGSGDSLNGNTVLGGLGVSYALRKPWYLEARFVYRHTRFTSVDFLGGSGTIGGISDDDYSLLTGLSYRFL